MVTEEAQQNKPIGTWNNTSFVNTVGQWTLSIIYEELDIWTIRWGYGRAMREQHSARQNSAFGTPLVTKREKSPEKIYSILNVSLGTVESIVYPWDKSKFTHIRQLNPREFMGQLRNV